MDASTGLQVWKYTAGDGVDSSPAMASGIVFAPSIDGNIYALNATTGAKVQNVRIGDALDSSPAISNGILYVGSRDSYLYAFGTLKSVMSEGSLGLLIPAIVSTIVVVVIVAMTLIVIKRKRK